MKITKIDVTKCTFWITLITSICLMVIGFFIPPKGQIDPSVLTATGLLLAFAALAEGVELVKMGHTARVMAGKTVVEFGDKSNMGHTNNDNSNIPPDNYDERELIEN